ncbi:amidase [Polymorphobacter sp.]|uniref:amidase n=1 Tax=Polymorphobacter sp. TaxID=1909290 RepID=UPI003F7108BD
MSLAARNRALNALVALLPPGPPPAFPIVGPLSGHSLAVKANIDVVGLATTAGLARGPLAAADAPLVAMLRAAGATVLGHANMDEAALGAVTDNPHWGRTENPHRPGYTAGGSSGGAAAAVAGGLATLGLGTDTLGSVRIPAAYTGVYGLKPGHGLLPMQGIVPLDPTLDVPGLLAGSVDDLEAAWGALVPHQPTSRVQRLALLAEVEAAPMVAAVRAGQSDLLLRARAHGLSVLQRPFTGLSLAVARLAGFHQALAAARLRLSPTEVSPRLARLLARADVPDAAAIGHARAAVFTALESADVLVMPTTPGAAFPHGENHPDQADFTALASLAGVPALSVPAGFDRDGLPVGVQLVGPPGSESTLIALARALQRGRD